MTIRNDLARAPEGVRQYSLSKDLGLTWSTPLNVQVADPNCKGSVVQWKRGGGMVLSTAASCVGLYISIVLASICRT
eukprot:m.168437 g.168437  ORF g.168437 m.168437 type:complete len:77 (-) comp15317_c0_seq14:24-254(-)